MKVATETAQVIEQQPAVKTQSNLSVVNFAGKQNIDDQKSKFISFGFMNDIIRSIRKNKTMDYDDIQPVSRELQSFFSAQRFSKQYNEDMNAHLTKGKRMKSFISIVFKANKKRSITFFCLVPFISLCGIMSPIAVRQFTSLLSPGLFYDCERIFTDPTYAFNTLPYSQGLEKAGGLLWGYILLIFFSQIVRVFVESIIYANTSRIGVSFTSGMLDILYNKILVLSDQARQSSATGNLVNLLYGDTQKVTMLLVYFYYCIMVPLDLVVNLVYVVLDIAPIALVGLSSYLLILPAMVLIMTFVVSAEKRVTGFRDMRVKRETEILNGIKVIKLFALEEIQERRVANSRKQEIDLIFTFAKCMSFFNVIAYCSAPLMTLIAFAGMIGEDQFDMSLAFTTMFTFQYLAQVIIMLPMIMSMVAQASIAVNRMLTFVNLPERDPGFVVRVDWLNEQEKKKVQNMISQTQSIKITGKPSFTWALSNDQIVPPMLNPFFQEHSQIMKKMTKNFQKSKDAAQLLINEAIRDYSNTLDMSIKDEFNQLKIGFDTEIVDFKVLDKWCTEFDINYLQRLENLEQYKPEAFSPLKTDNSLIKAKKSYLHIRAQQIFIKKEDKTVNNDLPDILKNLELDVKKGEIIGICGQVGCGKSSMFNAILGELRLSQKDRAVLDQHKQTEGYIKFDYNSCKYNDNDASCLVFSLEMPHVYINGQIAFFSQQPCIFNKTIRDNITMGMPFIKEKYDHIVDICCLLPDFDILAGGDLTEVGGRGVNLSGGQKARIALARAVYSDADILLLDDPLSAVDAHVGARLWGEVVMNYLKSKGTTVIIASHQTNFFQTCDRVVQLVNGEIAAFDTPQNLTNSGVQIMGLTDEASSSTFTNTVTPAGHRLKEKVIREEVTDSKPEEKKAKQEHKDADLAKGKLVDDEQLSGAGNISSASYKKWFKAGSVGIAIVAAIVLLLQAAVYQFQTIVISHWASNKYGWSKNPSPEETQQAMSQLTCQDDGRVYNGVSDCKQILLATLNHVFTTSTDQNVINGVLMCSEQRFNMQFKMPKQDHSKYIGLYAGIAVVMALLTYFGNVFFCKFAISAAKVIHQKMMATLLRVRMLFFDTTPQGRILNRLSKDTDSVDKNIMNFMQQVLSMVLMIIGMVFSIAATNYPALIVIVPALLIFIFIFQQFRQVFPHIKRIESITRSPVFNGCQETIETLTCIRAYGLEQQFKDEFRANININTCLFFEQYAINRWLGLRLGILTSFFAALVALAGLLIAPVSQEIASYTGVIVSNGQTIAFVLLDTVIQLVTLEGEMASVERVLEFTELEQEGQYIKPDFNQNNSWPQKEYEIEIKNLEFRYNNKQDYILKNLNFKMKPKEHVGIVGRTGAGKSSITVSLFRLAEAENQSEILIDGVNILNIGLHQARRSLAIIPQDPFLFSGTLRQNLCPVSQARAEGVEPDKAMKLISDDQLWSVLEQVQMKDYFMNQPGGLDARIAMNGDNLSAGQKQLVCVARALVRDVGCVILDEATAQVDRENDRLIQDTIRRNLGNTSIISIAHRLDTIIDFDRIIVMDAGQIVEYDCPATLLRNPDGHFTKLIERTGPEMCYKLKAAAFLAEEQRKQGIDVNVKI